MKRWYERESFPIECVCKFKKDDTSSVIDTIVKFTPNNGWYEFIGVGGNSYCVATPLKDFYEYEAELKAKDEHIDLCRKANTDLAAKCWGYVQQLKTKEKEIAILHELIQKQHVTQPIKILVCEQCGKEFGGEK